MRRVARNRQDLPDLLVRRPHIDRGTAFSRAWPVSSVDQCRALLDLLDRGLLSTEQFQQQQVRISRGQPW